MTDPRPRTITDGSGRSNPFANYDRDSHDFAIDDEGHLTSEIHFFNTRLDWGCSLGQRQSHQYLRLAGCAGNRAK